MKERLQEDGVIVPLYVKDLGNGTYEVIDGCRRTRLCRELNMPESSDMNVMIVDGSEEEITALKLNINNCRLSLGTLAEMETLKQFVEKGMTQSEAVKKLQKSEPWGSSMMKVWQLPKDIIASLYDGEISVSHGAVLAGYIEQPEILEMLFGLAKGKDVSHKKLQALGYIAGIQGISKAKEHKPYKIKVGDKSWLGVSPTKKGKRIGIVFDENDNIEVVVKELRKIFGKKRETSDV